MEDCSIGHCAVVWVRKPNFGSFCCGQPFVSLIVQWPARHFHFHCCESWWNWPITGNQILFWRRKRFRGYLGTILWQNSEIIQELPVYQPTYCTLKFFLHNTHLIWRTRSPGTWCRITDTSMKGLGPTKKIPIRQIEREWDLNESEIWRRNRQLRDISYPFSWPHWQAKGLGTTQQGTLCQRVGCQSVN